MKDEADKFMKNQLQLMSGSGSDSDDVPLELRKLPLTQTVDSPNYESTTLEELKVLSCD